MAAEMVPKGVCCSTGGSRPLPATTLLSTRGTGWVLRYLHATHNGHDTSQPTWIISRVGQWWLVMLSLLSVCVGRT